MQQRHANLKHQAIDMATQRIVETGLQGLNARFIAKAIGCSVGTLYNVFKNIDFLIFEVNMRTLVTLEKQLQKTHDLSEIITCYIDYAANNQNLWSTLFEHRFSNPNDTPSDYYNKRENLFHILEQSIAAKKPALSQHQVALEARALWAGAHGICSLMLNNKLSDDGFKPQDIANTLISKFDPQGAQQ